MFAERVVADYGITEGDCLLICKGDSELEQGLQQGLLEATTLKITALYPSKEAADQAEKKVRGAAHAGRIQYKVGGLAALPFADSSFDLVAGVGPVLIWEKDKAQAMREVYRVLRSGGTAILGGEYRGMPDFRKVSSDSLRESAAATGIPSIRVIDDMGQWVEVRKGIKDRGFCD
jgi:ubiquinone/menaquinone biosynthesis C-methylase UbiE